MGPTLDDIRESHQTMSTLNVLLLCVKLFCSPFLLPHILINESHILLDLYTFRTNDKKCSKINLGNKYVTFYNDTIRINFT